MTTWAIGDVQGCYDEYRELLDRIEFDPAHDVVWLVGDLVNRGPRSLDVLRHVHALGRSARLVLGNHELHLLATRFGGHSPHRGDTFQDVLRAPDADELCHWLRRQPLLISDRELGFVMTHAGIPHIWSLAEAEILANEVEAVLRGDGYPEYCRALYGNQPDIWDPALAGMDRWRVITNYFTRMRLVNAAGRLDFAYKGPVAQAPPEWHPWYELRARQPLDAMLLFGHWASLEGHTGTPSVIALDTGCVWGRSLRAFCLDDGKAVDVASHAPADARAAGGD
jgi:bis(5'-nucleosyl)-tetraphosphatase (symmetrical)